MIFSKSRALTSMSQDLSDGSKMVSEASVTAIDESPAKAPSANSDSRLLTIPTEVRESILKCLLCSPEPLCRVKRNPLVRPPLIPGDSHRNYIDRRTGYTFELYWHNWTIKCRRAEPEAWKYLYKSLSSGLQPQTLRVCKKLHSEG